MMMIKVILSILIILIILTRFEAWSEHVRQSFQESAKLVASIRLIVMLRRRYPDRARPRPMRPVHSGQGDAARPMRAGQCGQGDPVRALLSLMSHSVDALWILCGQWLFVMIWIEDWGLRIED